MSVNTKRTTDSSTVQNDHAKRVKPDRGTEDDIRTKDRIRAVLKREIQNEINIRNSDLEQIEDRIFETQKAIEKVRQGVVTEFYSQSYKGVLQPPPHPAVKDTFARKQVLIKKEDPSYNENPLEVTNLIAIKEEADSDSTFLSQKQPRYIPPKYEEKDIVQLFEPRGNERKEKYRLLIGNVSKWILDQEDSQVTHKWTVYMKCKRENGDNVEIGSVFSSVMFFLHPSYKPNDIIRLDNPPFKLTRRGWGEFPLRVRLYFANELNKSLDVVHHIKLDRTHSGLETFGAETIVDTWVHMKKDMLNESTDFSLQDFKKPPTIPSVSMIPFSNDISTDILSEIFGGPEEVPKATFIDDIDIKTECGDVPIEEIDIKPLGPYPDIIPVDRIKSEHICLENPDNNYQNDDIHSASIIQTDPSEKIVISEVMDFPEDLNHMISEEVIIESEDVPYSDSLNQKDISGLNNTEIKEEIIFSEPGEVMEEIVYDSDISEIKEEIIYENNCDNENSKIVNNSVLPVKLVETNVEKELPQLSNCLKPIQISVVKPQQFVENLLKVQLSPTSGKVNPKSPIKIVNPNYTIKPNSNLKTVKIIPTVKRSPIKIIRPPNSSKSPKLLDNECLKQQKVLFFDSVSSKTSNGAPLFKIVIDPATVLKLPKTNGVKTPKSTCVNQIPNINQPNKKKVTMSTGKLQTLTSLEHQTKPILVTTNPSGEKQTLVVQRKVFPGVSLLKKIEKTQDGINSENKQNCSDGLQEYQSEKIESAVKWLVKKYPLFDARASKESFRTLHPYCAPSRTDFLKWPLGKQRAAEWMRTKIVSRLLRKVCPRYQPWSIVQVLDWCRLMGFTPRDVSSGTEVTSVQEPISFNFSPPPNLKEKILFRPNGCEVINIIEDNSISSDSKRKLTEGKIVMHLPLENNMKGIGDFIAASCTHYVSKSVSKEEMITGDISYPAALAVLVSVFNSVAEDLIRRSYAASIIRHNNEPPEEIIENDVKNAIFSREEFDLFTNEGLGKEEDD